MKTTFRSLLFLAFATVATGSTLYAQSHTVTLHVDLDQLNQGNPSAACTLSADPSTEVIGDDSPESFTIVVSEGDDIEWEAVGSDGEEIDIENVEFMTPAGKEKPFRKDKLEGNRGNSGKKKVKDKVKNNTKGNTYKYNIEFIVNDEHFIVDPKVKVRA